jgi:hypothetical protein
MRCDVWSIEVDNGDIVHELNDDSGTQDVIGGRETDGELEGMLNGQSAVLNIK